MLGTKFCQKLKDHIPDLVLSHLSNLPPVMDAVSDMLPLEIVVLLALISDTGRNRVQFLGTCGVHFS